MLELSCEILTLLILIRLIYTRALRIVLENKMNPGGPYEYELNMNPCGCGHY